MANKPSSSATKNRRPSAAKPKAKAEVKAVSSSTATAKAAPKARKVSLFTLPKDSPNAGNKVVERRLAFLSASDLPKAAKEYANGAKVADLLVKYGPETPVGKPLSSTRFVYAVETYLVETKAIPRLAKTEKAIAKAKKDGESNARIAARAGISY